MLRVGLIGCGTIGSQLARALERRYAHTARIAALHDADVSHARALQRALRSRPPCVSLPQVIQRSDLVIEAASAEISGQVAAKALRKDRSVLIMSVGGLLRQEGWRRAARRSAGRLYIPSGALAGLDGVRALATGRIRRVRLTTRKPPQALLAAPFVRRRRLNLAALKRPRLLFEGSPAAAVAAFPQNVNVAAALTLAVGRGVRPRIRVIADPGAGRNSHEVEVEADCGRIACRIESEPSANPKTSELAVRSAIVTLGRIFDPVTIGT